MIVKILKNFNFFSFFHFFTFTWIILDIKRQIFHFDGNLYIIQSLYQTYVRLTKIYSKT